MPRPLVVTAFTTLDGVIQAPGGPEEDPSGGFAAGGWLTPFDDADFGRQMEAWFAPAQDFLLGRSTYETFAAFWPSVPVEAGEIPRGLNTKIKHVVSRTLTSLDWDTARLVEGTSSRRCAGSRRRTAASCRCTAAPGWCRRCWRTTWSTSCAWSWRR